MIPANDDAIKSVQVVTKAFADAVLEGKERASARQMEMAGEQENKGKDGARRREQSGNEVILTNERDHGNYE